MSMGTCACLCKCSVKDGRHLGGCGWVREKERMSEGSNRLQKHRVALGWPLVDAKEHT